MGMVLDLIKFLLDHAGPAVAPLIRQWIDLRGLTPPDPKAWADVDARIDAVMSVRDTDPAPAPSRPTMRFSGDD